MHERTKKTIAIFGSIAAAFCFTAISAQAGNNQTEASGLGATPGATWVTVEVTNGGAGPDVVRLTPEWKATFKVQRDSTAVEVTQVLIDGSDAELSAIPEGEIVHVHWRPVVGDHYGMFATKIVYLTEEAKDARKKEMAESDSE